MQIADHVLAAADAVAVAGELSNENPNQNHQQNRKLAFHSGPFELPKSRSLPKSFVRRKN